MVFIFNNTPKNRLTEAHDLTKAKYHLSKIKLLLTNNIKEVIAYVLNQNYIEE